MNKKIIIVTFVIVAIFFGFFGIQLMKSRGSVENRSKVITAGLKPSQQESFSNQLSNSFDEVELLNKGKALISHGKSDEAIVYFNKLMNDKSFGLKVMAKEYLIDAYEKSKNYNKAYSTLYADVQKYYKVSPSDVVRVPVEERIKYLKYASDGKYELAVVHAQLAFEASEKLPLNLKELSEGYKNRLNDLKAAKDYIESLKNKAN